MQNRALEQVEYKYFKVLRALLGSNFFTFRKVILLWLYISISQAAPTTYRHTSMVKYWFHLYVFERLLPSNSKYELQEAELSPNSECKHLPQLSSHTQHCSGSSSPQDNGYSSSLPSNRFQKLKPSFWCPLPFKPNMALLPNPRSFFMQNHILLLWNFPTVETVWSVSSLYQPTVATADFELGKGVRSTLQARRDSRSFPMVF